MEKEKNAHCTAPNEAKIEKTPAKVIEEQEEAVLAVAREILKLHQKAFLELAK